MSENSALRIHASIRPEASAREEGPNEAPGAARAAGPIRIEGAAKRPASGPRRRRVRTPMTYGERLMRNSAVACAVLLGVLAAGNIDRPWARKASESVERALTMHIDLDESIGALQFVKDIMPESALVFMNISGDTALARPVDGAVAHDWSNLQPWLMFRCEDGAEVRAAAQGTVTAVSPMREGRFGVLVDHGEGIETVYACLVDTAVETGDAVSRGQVLGTADDGMYFEYRSAGEAIDPTAALGL